MDMDFNDVFGGPPRRFSVQEMRKRHSFNDQDESEEDSPVSGLSEKPVFGGDRRRQGGEFYDDIFRGDEAYSSPRRIDMDTYGSTPGSRVLSPAWPLPPKTEPFATSLPAQFSLPAKLSKATEYPAFGASNGSLSRFRSQTKQQENESQMIYRQRSDEKDLEKEALSNVNQFHFSIYKWAGKGVPILTPLMRGKNSKSKENSRLERSLSSNNKETVFVATEAIPNISETKNLNNVKNKVVPEGPKPGSRLAEDGLRKKETESKQGNRETSHVAGEKKVTVTNARADDSNAQFNETMKKSDTKVDKNLKKREVKVNKNLKKNDVEAKINRVEVHDLPFKSEEKFTKVGVTGKVQEFANIFNQEKEKTQSRSSRWRGGKNINVVEKETASSTRQTNEEVQFPSMNKTADVSQSADDIFHGSFVVEELFQDQSKPLQKSDESNDVKASDAKIQQWSHGRKGNIRSLLSTLQLVLWAESGWKPVPLVDLIEGSSVKRAYQKALLCLHPDKLQQKGAASHQKYIAEKVFDILQEAWDHFNSLGGI